MPTGPTIPDPPRALTLEVNRTELRAWDWGPEDGAPIVCAHGAYEDRSPLHRVRLAEPDLGRPLWWL